MPDQKSELEEKEAVTGEAGASKGRETEEVVSYETTELPALEEVMAGRYDTTELEKTDEVRKFEEQLKESTSDAIESAIAFGAAAYEQEKLNQAAEQARQEKDRLIEETVAEAGVTSPPGFEPVAGRNEDLPVTAELPDLVEAAEPAWKMPEPVFSSSAPKEVIRSAASSLQPGNAASHAENVPPPQPALEEEPVSIDEIETTGGDGIAVDEDPQAWEIGQPSHAERPEELDAKAYEEMGALRDEKAHIAQQLEKGEVLTDARRILVERDRGMQLRLDQLQEEIKQRYLAKFPEQGEQAAPLEPEKVSDQESGARSLSESERLEAESADRLRALQKEQDELEAKSADYQAAYIHDTDPNKGSFDEFAKRVGDRKQELAAAIPLAQQGLSGFSTEAARKRDEELSLAAAPEAHEAGANPVTLAEEAMPEQAANEKSAPDVSKLPKLEELEAAAAERLRALKQEQESLEAMSQDHVAAFNAGLGGKAFSPREFKEVLKVRKSNLEMDVTRAQDELGYVAQGAADLRDAVPAAPAGQSGMSQAEEVYRAQTGHEPGRASKTDLEKSEEQTAKYLREQTQQLARIEDKLKNRDAAFRQQGSQGTLEEYVAGLERERARLAESDIPKSQEYLGALATLIDRPTSSGIAEQDKALPEEEPGTPAGKDDAEAAEARAREVFAREIGHEPGEKDDLDELARGREVSLGRLDKRGKALAEGLEKVEAEIVTESDPDKRAALEETKARVLQDMTRNEEAIAEEHELIEALGVIANSEKEGDAALPAPTDADVPEAMPVPAEQDEPGEAMLPDQSSLETVAGRIGHAPDEWSDLSGERRNAQQRWQLALSEQSSILERTLEIRKRLGDASDAQEQRELRDHLRSLGMDEARLEASMQEERELIDAIGDVENEIGLERLLAGSRKGYVDATESLKEWMRGEGTENTDIGESTGGWIARGWNMLTKADWQSGQSRAASAIVDEAVAEMLRGGREDGRSVKQVVEEVAREIGKGATVGGRFVREGFFKGMGMETDTASRLIVATEAKLRYDEYRRRAAQGVRESWGPIEDFDPEVRPTALARRNAEIFERVIVDEYHEQAELRAQRLVEQQQARDAERGRTSAALRDASRQSWELVSRYPKRVLGWYGRQNALVRLGISSLIGTGILTVAAVPAGGISALTMGSIFGMRLARAGLSVMTGKATGAIYEQLARGRVSEEDQVGRIGEGESRIEDVGDDREYRLASFASYETALGEYARQQAVEQRIARRKNIAKLLGAGTAAIGATRLGVFDGLGTSGAKTDAVMEQPAAKPQATPAESPEGVEPVAQPTAGAETPQATPDATPESPSADAEAPSARVSDADLPESKGTTPAETVERRGFEITKTDNSIWRAVSAQAREYVARQDTDYAQLGLKSQEELASLRADLQDGTLTADSQRVLDRIVARAITANGMQNMGISKVGEHVLWTPDQSGGKIEFGSGEKATYAMEEPARVTAPPKAAPDAGGTKVASALGDAPEKKVIMETAGVRDTAPDPSVPETVPPVEVVAAPKSAVEIFTSREGVDLEAPGGLGSAPVQAFLAGDGSALRSPTGEVVTYSPGFKKLYESMRTPGSAWQPKPEQYGLTVRQFVESKLADGAINAPPAP